MRMVQLGAAELAACSCSWFVVRVQVHLLNFVGRANYVIALHDKCP